MNKWLPMDREKEQKQGSGQFVTMGEEFREGGYGGRGEEQEGTASGAVCVR
jgi:hypothetical protein